MGRHSMTPAAPSTVPSVAAVKPADRLRAEQFGKGRHAAITPASVGSHPMGNGPLSTGRHAAGPVNSKGKNLGSYAGAHAGAEKPVAAAKHASNAPASVAAKVTKLKDKTALKNIELGKGYAPKHAAGDQGTGSHAMGNKPKTQMAPNEARNDAEANMPKAPAKKAKPSMKDAASGTQAQHFNHPALGPASQEGGNARILKAMTGAM